MQHDIIHYDSNTQIAYRGKWVDLPHNRSRQTDDNLHDMYMAYAEGPDKVKREAWALVSRYGSSQYRVDSPKAESRQYYSLAQANEEAVSRVWKALGWEGYNAKG